MTSFLVERLEPLRLNTTAPLSCMRAFAPFVWQTTYGFEMLLSAAPLDDKHSSIFHGTSSDGIYFALDRYPALDVEPPASHGCHDACVLQDETGYVAYYGTSAIGRPNGTIEMATGTNIHELRRNDNATVNTSEGCLARPEVATISDGRWALFHEKINASTSSVVRVQATAMRGPWSDDHLFLEARDGQWDALTVATGPVVRCQDDWVMFYAGSGTDSHWQLGWALLDDEFRVKERCTNPLMGPHDDKSLQPAMLAASAIPIGAQIWLYVSGSRTPPHRIRLRKERR